MYLYAVSELDRSDSIKAKVYHEKLHPQVKRDIDEYRKFLMKYRNQIEPVISWIYDGYLQANDQPEGKKSYNMVVAYLIAYYKKYGKDAM